MNTNATTRSAVAYSLLTLSDGALRMLVMFHLATVGYSALDLAFVFAGYELAGVFTNLYGGRLASRIGLRNTMSLGLSLQVAVLSVLALTPTLPGVWFLCILQGLSGVAKDLTKVGAKSSVATHTSGGQLFAIIALVTGAKNTLKGIGFFLGAVLFWSVGLQPTLIILAVIVSIGIIVSVTQPRDRGEAPETKFRSLLSQIPQINLLAVARLFLFGSRDIWLAIGMPLFFAAAPGWGFWQSGAVMAGYTIMYGLIQAATPRLLHGRPAPGGIITALVTAIPALVCIGVAVLEWRGGLPPWGMVIMIGIYSSCFAVASAIHSYLIAAYAQAANVSKNIGLYYSANAVGRLCGVLLSGYCYVEWGIIGCVLGAALFCIPAIVCALPLPRPAGTMQISGSTE
jgi:predicted MFS family arabinose efflux permease